MDNSNRHRHLDLPTLLAIKKVSSLKEAGQIADLFLVYRKVGLSKYEALFASVEANIMSSGNQDFFDFVEVEKLTKNFLESAGIYTPMQKFQRVVSGIFKRTKCH